MDKKEIGPGYVSNNLTVLEILEERSIDKRKQCRCLCNACGKETVKLLSLIRNGRLKTCGCGIGASGGVIKGIKVTKADGTSYMSYNSLPTDDPLVKPWKSMLRRCSEHTGRNGKNYRGKGISYDPRFKDFEFFKSVAPGGYEEGLTIERIDNSKGYYEGNIRWATPREQANNRSTNVVTRDVTTGEEVTISRLSRRYKIPYQRLMNRYNDGDRGIELIRPTKSEVKEIKKMLWSNTVSEVSVLTNRSEEYIESILNQDIFDSVKE